MFENNNIGSGNIGYSNIGDNNTGKENKGDNNTGNWNKGNNNTGSRNTGNWNTGYGNAGSRNTGNWNTGYGNTGYGNTTNRSSGIFCTKEQNVILFNKDSGLKWDQINHPHFCGFYLTKWISKSEMTDDEKKENPTFNCCGGYLKSFTYKEAWANFWRDTDQDNRLKFLNLPNFDAQIFKEITGIDLESKSCAGKIVEIEGKKYRLTEV